MKRLFKYTAIFCMAFGIAGTAGYLGIAMFTQSAPEVILPDFKGKNIIQVLETLTRMGLNPKLRDTRYHDAIPKYGIIFQDPGPGSTIKTGRDVVIHISKGVKARKVPDLRRMPLKEALLALEDKELATGRIVYTHSRDTLKGAVMAQYPLPLAETAAHTGCNLLVSSGPPDVWLVVPDLTGMTLDQASTALDGRPIRIGEIRSGTDKHRPRGGILRHTPGFGTPVPAGTSLALVVNLPESGRVMPPDRLRSATWIPIEAPQGFSNRHVRVVTDMFGEATDYISTYVKPGKNINLLIPGGITTKIRIFIDHRLVETRTIDPWKTTSPWESWTRHFFTGDRLWE